MTTVKDILDRPYTKVVRKDAEGDFVARILELPGCVADGETEAQALKALEEAQALWVESALKAGLNIPEPAADDDDLPSGKWVQRVPRTLHRTIVELAERDGVSLNQWVTSVLAAAAGQRSAVANAVRNQAGIFAQFYPHQVLEMASTQVHVGGSPYELFEWMSENSAPPKTTNILGADGLTFLRCTAKRLPDRFEVSAQELFYGHHHEEPLRHTVRGVPKKRSAGHDQP